MRCDEGIRQKFEQQFNSEWVQRIREEEESNHGPVWNFTKKRKR